MCEHCVEYEYMPINERAVRELIQKHQAEYDELSGKLTQARIEELERNVRVYVDQINELRKMNPQGVNVGAIASTTNILAAENKELTERASKLKRENESLKRKLEKFEEALIRAQSE